MHSNPYSYVLIYFPFFPHDNCDFNSYFGSLFYVINWSRNSIDRRVRRGNILSSFVFPRSSNSLPCGSSISLLYFLSYRHSIWLYRLLRSRAEDRDLRHSQMDTADGSSSRTLLDPNYQSPFSSHFFFSSSRFLLSSYFPQLSCSLSCRRAPLSLSPPLPPFFSHSPISPSPYTDFLPYPIRWNSNFNSTTFSFAAIYSYNRSQS